MRVGIKREKENIFELVLKARLYLHRTLFATLMFAYRMKGAVSQARQSEAISDRLAIEFRFTAEDVSASSLDPRRRECPPFCTVPQRIT